jgi:hypothetical protein
MAGRGLRWAAPAPLEENEQQTFFEWLEFVHILRREAIVQDAVPTLLKEHWHRLRPHCHAVPNQRGSRSRANNAILKAQGVTSGVSDISVLVPSGGFHGLYLEMKRQGATDKALSDSQREQIMHRLEMGYDAQMVAGFAAARAYTCKYLSPTWHVRDPFEVPQ